MRFQKEYWFCFAAIAIMVLYFIFSSLLTNIFLRFTLAVLDVTLGSVMIVLGFWGSDFAFALVSHQLNQSKEKGEFKGSKKKIYVPFMKNYSPLEWWNLNWFVTLIGAVILSFGTLNLGFLFAAIV